MSLNEFLEDRTLGSWADEMDSLPTAPAPRLDDSSGRDFRGRDDYLSSRPDRAAFAPREDVPLPTNPPFTAFVGNLAFDLTEGDLGSFFGSDDVVKGAKIIRDRDDKPKGFGYVEFHTVEGLREALAKNGASFSHRSIRVNIADPPKERPGFHGHAEDDKFAGSWRRDGPLPDLDRRETSTRRRYEGLGSENRDSAPDNSNNWRSSRPPPRIPNDLEAPPVRRRGSGFSTPTHEGEAGPADTEEKWAIGSRFKPSQHSEERSGGRFGSMRGRGDMGPPPSAADEVSSWRKPGLAGSSPSPSNSVPPTPQLARRKLELLPRSTSGSSHPTPVSSPQSTGFSSSKPNPFGSAKPVDVSAREAAAVEKIEKEQEEIRERVAHQQHQHQQHPQHSMSRQSSRQPRGRPGSGRGEIGARSPSSKPGAIADEKSPGSPRASNLSSPGGTPAPSSTSPNVAAVATIRPSFSFASAAAGKKDAAPQSAEDKSDENTDAEKPADADADADAVADKLAEVNV
ncbi:TIF3 [Sanghuangporus weigelae]